MLCSIFPGIFVVIIPLSNAFYLKFQEYNPELAQLSKKKGMFANGGIEDSNGVIGTAIRQDSYNNGRSELPDHQRRHGDS